VQLLDTAPASSPLDLDYFIFDSSSINQQTQFSGSPSHFVKPPKANAKLELRLDAIDLVENAAS